MVRKISEVPHFHVRNYLFSCRNFPTEGQKNTLIRNEQHAMIALIQRVTEASVAIDQKVTAQIGVGILALVGIEKPDTHKSAEELARKILTFRLFSDSDGKMNLDIQGTQGQILLVPQFTLVADTHKGRRPGFSNAATPAQGREMFDELVSIFTKTGLTMGTGTFGADMKVALINDGPVTFWLQT